MSKEQITKLVDSFFNVDGKYSQEDLEQFEKSHSYISVGIMVLGVIAVLLTILIFSPQGHELDYIPNYD